MSWDLTRPLFSRLSLNSFRLSSPHSADRYCKGWGEEVCGVITLRENVEY